MKSGFCPATLLLCTLWIAPAVTATDAVEATGASVAAVIEDHVTRAGYGAALAQACGSEGKFRAVSGRLVSMLRSADEPGKLRRLGDSRGGSPWRSERNCRCARGIVQVAGGNWRDLNGFLLGQAGKAERAFAVRKGKWTYRCDA